MIKRPVIVILLLTLLWSAYVYAQAGPGDGYLLKRSEEETCHACHKTDRNTSPTDPTWPDAIKIHNADRFGKCSDPTYDGTSASECTNAGGTWTATSKWAGNWGLSGGKYGEFRCTTCHTAHGTRNIFLVRESIKTPDGSNWDSIGTSDTLTVDFRVKTGTPGSAPYAMGDDTACSDPSYTNQTDCETNGGTWTPRASSTRPCEACHSITGYHRYDTTGQTVFGHNNAVDCNTCHSHKTGFVGKGCDTCHGFPPIVDTAGGPQGLVNDPDWGVTGSVTSGAHNKHVKLKGYSCDTCHNGGMDGSTPKDHSITIGFNLFGGAYTSGTYDGQSTLTNGYSYASGNAGSTVTSGGTLECSNLYCHGNTLDVGGDMDGGTDITPVWNDPSTGTCGTCHGATPAASPLRGMHYRHTSDYYLHEYPCDLCHKDPSVDDSLHVNNQSEVIFSADPKTSGGTYDGTTTVMDGYGNCKNIYCHSNVQTDPPGGALTYATVNWTYISFEQRCDLCHEGESDHYSSPMSGNTTGSHTKHASYNRFGCVTCHATGDPTTDPEAWGGWDCWGCHAAYHADHSVDVIFLTKYGGTYSGTPQPGDAYGDCSNTYCHSIGDTSVTPGQLPSEYGGSIYTTISWGSGPLGCNACHGRTTTDGMPDYTNGGAGTASANSHAIHVVTNGITCNICHYNVTTDGTSITNTLYHINKNNTEVSFDPSGGGSGGTYNPAIGSKTCTSVSCHPGQTPQWGGP